MSPERYNFNLNKFEEFLEKKQLQIKIALASELKDQKQIFMTKAVNP